MWRKWQQVYLHCAYAIVSLINHMVVDYLELLAAARPRSSQAGDFRSTMRPDSETVKAWEFRIANGRALVADELQKRVVVHNSPETENSVVLAYCCMPKGFFDESHR